MMRRLFAIALLLATASATADEASEVAAELDAVWATVSESARTGNFEMMASVYHPDAVLVSEIRGRSMPISKALEIWRPGIEATKRGETTASVEFRFTRMLSDDTSAHQVGLFRYEDGKPGEESSVVYIHFEALFVKRDGWKMLMENQQGYATKAEWDAAAD